MKLNDKDLKAKLSKIVAEHGFHIVDVPNDGNCGMHIVDQLSAHGVFVDASSLRKQAVSYLQNHP